MKLVQHAEFNIQFTLDHVHELAQQHFRVEHELRSDKALFDSQKEIEDLTTKLDELKEKQKKYIKI